jgi:hypothetical protein
MTLLPLNAGHVDPTHDQDRWSDWLAAPRKVALLVGGSSRSHRLDKEQAEALARQVSTYAREQQAELLVVGSRRSMPIEDALQAGLAADDAFYRWRPDDPQNPYQLALVQADTLIVSGESESMLADAASQGRGFLIWPLEPRPLGPWARLSREVSQRAIRPRFNRRGSIRPQQGQTYLAARALERGWILPPRDIEALHSALQKAGIAAPFGQPVPSTFRPMLNTELDRTVVEAVDQLSVKLAPEPQSIQANSQTHEH